MLIVEASGRSVLVTITFASARSEAKEMPEVGVLTGRFLKSYQDGLLNGRGMKQGGATRFAHKSRM